MRVAVTSIMLDEPLEFIHRWAQSAQDADDLVLVDTGSTNGAIDYARGLGLTVHEITVNPWRFDDARNAGLTLLPECDVVITLDVDEVLEPGWREALEGAGPGARYSYHYQWNEDISFTGDRVVSRHGWRWRHPVHETLTWAGEGPEPATVPTEMRFTHLADPDKPRSQYLPLLAQAVREDPDDDRMAHYFARELFFNGLWDQAREQFARHLSLPTAKWAAERAQSYRYLAKMDDYPERWLLKAVAEDPTRREAWVDLMEFHLAAGHTGIAAGFARRALLIHDRKGDYMNEAAAWDDQRLIEVAS